MNAEAAQIGALLKRATDDVDQIILARRYLKAAYPREKLEVKRGQGQLIVGLKVHGHTWGECAAKPTPRGLDKAVKTLRK